MLSFYNFLIMSKRPPFLYNNIQFVSDVHKVNIKKDMISYQFTKGFLGTELTRFSTKYRVADKSKLVVYLLRHLL